MSEEEKKAIEYIKEFKNEVFEGVGNKSTMAKNIDILLNLIDKQQKEIEELKKPKYIIDCKTNKITKLTNDFISKDKIREKIKKAKEIKWHTPKLVIEYFEELLEEK